MNVTPRGMLYRWGLTTFAVFVATRIVPGIECDSFVGLLATALVLGLLNAFVRPFLLFVSLPLVVLSCGLFLWVINAGLLFFASHLIPPFTVDSFTSALGGSAVIGLVSFFGGRWLGLNRLDAPRTPRPPRSTWSHSDSGSGSGSGSGSTTTRRPPFDDGAGPVIDV